jgi:ribosome biogenesis protein UTP30
MPLPQKRVKFFFHKPDVTPNLTKMDKNQVEKAVRALLKWNSKKENQLIEQKDFLYLQVALPEIPKKLQVKPKVLELKYPIHEDDSFLVFVTDDYDGPLPHLKIKDLKAKKSHQEKRNLSTEYDLFFADKRVIPLLPRLLGKSFFLKKKVPIPLDLKKSPELVDRDVKKIKASTVMNANMGTCLNIKVATVDMELGEIVENIMIVSDQLEFKQIHLKLLNSTSLPLIQYF